ncbi:MAG: helix-turn-helix domain-containing protein [Spirochaetales bacterium]|nr:helix-turn-helix domain-containing protein [Candidatus Physcosoma equi]
MKYLPQSLENIQESLNVEPSSFDDGLEALEDRLTVEDLLKTIYTLNAFYGEILRRKYAGDSERSIAKAVGLTHGTVNRELKKAYDLARRILEGIE